MSLKNHFTLLSPDTVLLRGDQKFRGVDGTIVRSVPFSFQTTGPNRISQNKEKLMALAIKTAKGELGRDYEIEGIVTGIDAESNERTVTKFYYRPRNLKYEIPSSYKQVSQKSTSEVTAKKVIDGGKRFLAGVNKGLDYLEGPAPKSKKSTAKKTIGKKR